ncbi:MAG: PAS domain S-box protein [Spirochaetes bacterium]|nr:PAS domain S-box protein [Spirochaetota bacterium]
MAGTRTTKTNPRRSDGKSASRDESLYRALMESVADAILIADMKGILTDANRRAADLLAIPRRTLIGMRISQIHPPDEATRIRAAFASLKKRESMMISDVSVLKADGERIPVEITGTIMKLGNRRLALGIFRDQRPRIRDQEKIRESEEKFRLLFNSGNDAVFVHGFGPGGEIGRFTEVNDVACRVLGYSRKELLKKTPLDIDPHNSPDELERIKASLMRDGQVIFETHHRTKSGIRIPVEINSLAVEIDGRPSIISIARDVTERMRVEQELRASERNYREIFNSTRDAIVIHDAKTGSILDINDAAERMYGIARNDIQRLTIEDLSVVDEGYTLKAASARIAEAKKKGSVTFEWHARDRDGRTFWVEVTLNRTEIAGKQRVIAVVRDIEDRRRADERLSTLSRAVEQSPVSIVITDEKGDLEFVNPAFAEVTGYAPEEVIGKNPRILKSGLMDQSVYEELWRIIAGGNNWKGEFINRKKNGDIYWEHAVISPVKNSRGDITHYVGVKDDVTELITTQKALKTSEERYRILSEITSDYAYSARVDADGSVHIEWITEAFTRITGYDVGLINEKSFFEILVHEEDRPALKRRFERLLSGNPDVSEYRIWTKDRLIRWVRVYGRPVRDEESGRVVRIIAAAQDITVEKDAQDRIAAQNAFMMMVLESIPYPFFVIDTRDYSVKIANSATRNMGIDINDKCYCLMHKKGTPCADEGFACPMVEVLRTRKPFVTEHVHAHPGAEDKIVEVHAFPITDSSGAVSQMIEYQIDITERTRKDRLLHEAQEKYRALVEHVPAVTYISALDDASTTIYVSPQIKTILGIEPETFIKSPELFFAMMVEEDRPGVLEALKRAHHGGGTFVAEYRMRNPSGEIVWLRDEARVVRDERGTPLFMQGLMIDLTERKDMELALQRFRAAIDSSADSIYIIDAEEMRFIDVNATATDMLGYTREELLAMGPHDLDPNYLYSEIQDTFNDVIARFPEKRVIESQHIRKDGTLVPVEVYMGAFHSGEGWLVIGVVRDITERKRNHEMLQRAKYEAEKANRAKSEFLANMSHELRTPLNAILGFSQLLERHREEDRREKLLEYIGYIQQSGKHLLEMVNDILDLAKIESGRLDVEKKRFHIAGMIAGSISTVRSIAEKKGLEVVQNIPPDVGWLVADEVRIKQIMFNLLSNAIKFTERGKRIGVDALPAGDHVEITVWDEGRGIDAADLGRIFDPFEQVSSSSGHKEQGTGLGLSITRRLVQLHGGTIAVKSAPGAGSRFTVTIPGRSALTESPAPTSFNVEHRDGPAQGLRKTVLIVDDNEINLRLLATALKQFDFNLLSASSGEKALELAAEKIPDLVIMDIQLPGMNGVEAMKTMRRIVGGKTSFIALTAHAMKGDRERFMAEGFDGYISKPISIPVLYQTIRDLVR